jgi:glutamyl-Q tRNA(Asp) synthetase
LIREPKGSLLFSGLMINSLPALSPLISPPPSGYIGRFAPSPTGPLHFGSLVSALASYLHAYHHQGLWLVRMEDLDPPREQPGAADAILHCLEDHGLEWAGQVLYQSQRLRVYDEVLASLQDEGLLYACDCTRQDLQAMGGIYNGHCRHRRVDTTQPHALRLKLYDLPQGTSSDEISFVDLIQGRQTQNLRTAAGDQILKRKDGLFAYQLAVVVDDIAQQVSHIIRGNDLLEVSARQLFLFRLLGAREPVFGHVPLVLNASGQKLSKQNLAPPLASENAGNNIWRALAFLGQNPPRELNNASAAEVLTWGKAHWDITCLQPANRYVPDQPDKKADDITGKP